MLRQTCLEKIHNFRLSAAKKWPSEHYMCMYMTNLSSSKNVHKWSKNFDKRLNHRRNCHWRNLMWHFTASVADQSECWSKACREIPASWQLGMVLGGVWENPDIILPQFIVPCDHPNTPPKRHLYRFSRFCRSHGRDQQADRQPMLLSLQ